MFKFSCFATAALAICLAGCGGSGAGTSSTNTSSQAATVGNATIKFQGKLQSKVGTNTGSISVVGTAGADITEFNYNPAQVLANSNILYSDGIELGLYANGNASIFSGSTGFITDYCFTQYGQILLCLSDSSTGFYQIYSCNEDGSALTRITSNAEDHLTVSVAPGNTSIVYVADNNVIKTCSFTGGNVQTLGPTGNVARYSPDGKQILYSGVPGGLYLIPAGGGASVAFDTGITANNALASIGWSADSSKVVFTYNNIVYVCSAQNNGTYLTVPQGSGNDPSATIGPDNKTLAYVNQPSGNTPDSLIVAPLDGDGQTASIPSNPGYPISKPVWSPFFASKSFAGPTGSFFPTASGFLWTERGSAFSSLLCFTATTPSAATLTPETTGSGTSALVYDCHADNITGLKYTNNYYVPPVSITPNVSDFLVSFDATTGAVTTIAPFVKSNSNKKLVGSVATYTGKFSALYNAKGKNLAPSGATTLSLDTTTGKLLNWK